MMSKIRFWARRNPGQALSIVAAIVLHITALVVIARMRPPPTPLTRHTPVAVKTIKLRPKPPPPAPKKLAKPVAAKPTPPKNEANEKKKPKKKKPVAKPVKKKQPSKKQETAKKEVKKKPENKALAEAKAILDSIPASRTSSKPTVTEEPSLSAEEAAYTRELIAHLRLLLQLPDYGEVVVRLTLARDGSVKGIEVVKAKSKANATYISDKLPALQLPPYGRLFGNSKSHDFLLALQNE